MDQVNKQRKKQGKGSLVLNNDGKQVSKIETTFKGRNFILPIVLILFIGMYNIIMFMNTEFVPSGMFWFTNIAYVAMAALFFFRRPYLTIGKDYVQTRRMMGDKQQFAVAIKEIKVLTGGYIIIVPNHGSSWGFNKMFNRFPIDEMKVELKKFADKHNITWTE